MGARYPYYLLADSRNGHIKEGEITHKVPSEAPTYNDIRQGFVYERVPHITLKSIANNAEIDVIWEKHEERLAPLRDQLSGAIGQTKTLEEWEIPREIPEEWTEAARPLHEAFWKARVARQREIDGSIAAKADYEYLYDKPYEDNKKVHVAGPFTVESLSPHRLLGVDEDDELIDQADDRARNVAEARLGYGDTQDFTGMILDNLKTSGVQQSHKEDRIVFSALRPWPGELVCAEGTYDEGNADSRPQRRAGIFIGPEFGTVSRPDLVQAAREAADAGFDVLIACAFNYDAHASEFSKLGRIPILKARMNADLHMADDLKNTGKGNLFVIFGEPDITVASDQWLVASKGRMVANYEHFKELSGLGSLEEINRLGREGLSTLCTVSAGREVRSQQPSSEIGGLNRGEHRGGSGATGDQGISAVSGDRERVSGRDGDLPDSGAPIGHGHIGADRSATESGGRNRTDAQRSKTLAALQNLSSADFPLSLTTGHWSQVTVHGVDVFPPQHWRNPKRQRRWHRLLVRRYRLQPGRASSCGTPTSLAPMTPTRPSRPPSKPKSTRKPGKLSTTTPPQPFPKPTSGRIAVKVINHLGDEVMKVFRV